jgi:hypothetical protein
VNLKGVIFGVMGLAASFSVSAQTINFGSFVLDFDETTAFGAPSFSFGGGGGLVGFAWTVPESISIAVNDDVNFLEFDLPSFTITAPVGYQLSGPVSGFLGNLIFNEFGDTQATALISGNASVDGGAPLSFAEEMTRTVTTSIPDVFTGGYFSSNGTVPLGNFTSLAFDAGRLTLSVFGTGSILAQPQNELRISFFSTPAPVPVPTAILLFASALGGLGVLRRRSV